MFPSVMRRKPTRVGSEQTGGGTHVRSSGRDGGRVEGGVGGESLEDHQVVGSVELSGRAMKREQGQ